MPEFDQEQLRKWAVSGAEQRLLEIAAEAAAIYRAFPELRERGAGRQASGGRARAAGSTAKAAPRARRKLSAAARKRISDAQKKRWAAHRRGANASR